MPTNLGDGDDIFNGGAGEDNIRGGAGDDTLLGGLNADKLYGQEGDDELQGGSGGDRLYGGDDEDRIVGGDGNDVLHGDNAGDGDDAEGWSDTFVFDNNDGNDVVNDFEDDLDEVELTSGGTYSLSYEGNNTVLTYGSTTVTFRGVILEADDFSGATLV